MFAVNGILFNHESPRRGETFVTRKITRAVARIKAGLEQILYMGNLDAVRDWGYAPEYVEGMWRMLQADEPDDYVLATRRRLHRARLRRSAAFAHAGLDWESYVQFDERYLRPTEVDALIGDATQGRRNAGVEGHRAHRRTGPDHGRRRHRGARVARASRGSTSRPRRVWATAADDSRLHAGRARSRRAGLRRRAPWPRRLGDLAQARGRGLRRSCRRSVAPSSTCTDRAAAFDFFATDRPDVVVLAAAKVGGILANNTYPVDFLSENLRIQVNVLDAALAQRRRAAAVPRLVVHLPEVRAAADHGGLRCSPAPSSRPTTPTRSRRSRASLQVQAVRRQYGLPWISAMPTNLYGPGDNFSPCRLPCAARAHPTLRRGAQRAARRR